MATRSIIAKSLGEGQAKVVYCHWDGYPSYVGRILLKNYDAAKLDELLALGDLSVLGENLGEKHDFGKDIEGVCTFYGRDRGEAGTDAEVVSEEAGSIRKYANERGTEYVYLLRDHQWFYLSVYGSDSDFAPLTEEAVSTD